MAWGRSHTLATAAVLGVLTVIGSAAHSLRQQFFVNPRTQTKLVEVQEEIKHTQRVLQHHTGSIKQQSEDRQAADELIREFNTDLQRFLDTIETYKKETAGLERKVQRGGVRGSTYHDYWRHVQDIKRARRNVKDSLEI